MREVASGAGAHIVVQRSESWNTFSAPSLFALVASLVGCSVDNAVRAWLSSSYGVQVMTFRVPPFYSLIVRTLTILEGLALFVDPDFRLIKVCENLLCCI